MIKRILQKLGLLAAVLALSGATASAGTFDFNFNTDPSGILDITGNNPEPWKSAGGNPGGYLSITDSVNGQATLVIFDDFDKGLIVKSFKFSMDVRIGNAIGNGGRPADGFSVNYARSNDPVVNGAGNAGFAASGAPETGTTTGIAISFDTWSGNALPDGPDIEGIIVRVDNKTVLRYALPTRNGTCTDITSLQTGPYTPETEGSPDGLCWTKFEVELDEAAKLTVKFKGATLLDKVQTTFFPSAGRLVLAGRTGGANENHHVDNIHIETVPSDKALMSGVTAVSATGFTVAFDDSGTSVVDPNSIAVQLDGVAITPTSTSKTGGTTSLRFENTGAFYASGSEHVVTSTFKDTAGTALTGVRPFTIPAYATLAASQAGSNASGNGFKVRVHQLNSGRGPGDANSILNGESQLAGWFYDATTGEPLPNVADLSGATGGIYTATLVNWDQDLGAQGNFNVNTTPETPDEGIPGIPGEGGTDNIAAEITAFLELKRGSYVMGVNSDDGFAVSVGTGPADVTGAVIGSFNGGRGASDTLFSFVAEQDGVYPFRLTWWEGGGGANVEWFSVDPDGTKRLINNRADVKAIKAYPNGRSRAYIKQLAGLPGRPEFRPNQDLTAVVVDDLTSVVAGSVELVIDGAKVTPTVAKSGSETKITYRPAGGWSPKRYNASLSYKESTNPESTRKVDFRFQVKTFPFDLPANSFTIEAEHFDNGGRATINNGSGFTGDEYAGQTSVKGTDYNNATEADSLLYRDAAIAVNMNDNIGGRWGAKRPGFDVTTNFKIGWVAAGEWYNYTRQIPAGLYKAYAALSYDGIDDNQLRARLSQVTAGVGTANQTVVELGRFNAPGSGGWGPNDLVVMRRAFDGSEAIIKSSGGATTLRFDTDSGDYDYFTLVPVTGVPPAVTALNVGHDRVLTGTGELKLQITDYSAALDASSVKLSVDGTDVSSGVTVTKSGDVSTVTYAGSASFTPLTSHTYALTFRDTAGNAGSNSGTFVATPQRAGSFVIEAEDFNYDGGKTQTAASTMPYLGNAYNNLGAVHDVDYHNADGNDSDVYRKGETPNTNINDNGGFRDRGAFSVTTNYKIGWIGSGDWFNYTRNIPAGDYEVWAALSFDGRAAGQLNGSLQRVTSDPAQPNQTLEDLGTFDAPGSGGWGPNNFVPLMKDGQKVVLSLNGLTTLRVNNVSGDADYYILMPSSGGGAIRFSSIKLSGNNVVVEWTGGGTLQASDSIGGNWTNVEGASPVTVPLDRAKRFMRIMKP